MGADNPDKKPDPPPPPKPESRVVPTRPQESNVAKRADEASQVNKPMHATLERMGDAAGKVKDAGHAVARSSGELAAGAARAARGAGQHIADGAKAGAHKLENTARIAAAGTAIAVASHVPINMSSHQAGAAIDHGKAPIEVKTPKSAIDSHNSHSSHHVPGWADHVPVGGAAESAPQNVHKSAEHTPDGAGEAAHEFEKNFEELETEIVEDLKRRRNEEG